MSEQMRKLIDLIEEKQLEAEILNEAPLSPFKKAMATGAALGSLATGAIADEPAQMDPGADANKSQAVQSVKSDFKVHPSFGELNTPATNYTTTQHHKVASDIIKLMYNSYNFEAKELEKLEIKDYQYRQNDTKVDMGMGFYKTPYTDAIRLKQKTATQAKYDLQATRYVLTNPRFIERYAGNPNKAKRNIAPGIGSKAGVAALKLYLGRTKSFEAPGSAGRNVPQ